MKVKTKEINERWLRRTRESLKKTKVHAISSLKGGLSKSTSSSNLAYVMAQRGLNVLLIDTDPQSSLTGLTNIVSNEVDKNIPGLYDLYEAILEGGLNKEMVDELIQKPSYEVPIVNNRKNSSEITYQKEPFGFSILPADIILTNMEITLAQSNTGGMKLTKILNFIKANYQYDYIFIDCPPGLSMLTYNAIAASVDGILVPIALDSIMSLKGARNVLTILAEVQNLLAPVGIIHRGCSGIFVTQYSQRIKIQKAMDEAVDIFFPIHRFETKIPNRNDCNVAHASGQLFAQLSQVAYDAYDNLALEIIKEDELHADDKESIIVENFGKEYSKYIKGLL